MFISRFFRVDTVSWPDHYMSTIRVMDGEGQGEDIEAVSETIRGDMDSIDGILIMPESDTDPESMQGIHTLIRSIRSKRIPTVLNTSGKDTAAVDDLLGAGYVQHVVFRLDGRPTKEQLDTMRVVRSNDAEFSICVTLDSARITNEDIISIAEDMPGHREFVLKMPEPPRVGYKKKDLNALAKSLKGIARNVRVAI